MKLVQTMLKLCYVDEAGYRTNLSSEHPNIFIGSSPAENVKRKQRRRQQEEEEEEEART